MAVPLKLLPSAIVVLSGTAFALSYFLAVDNHHIHKVLPYISNTGSRPPESSWFTFFLTMTAILTSVLLYSLYRHLSYKVTSKYLRRANHLGHGAGQVAALGLLMVAAFQNINVWPLHLSGAAMCFFGGSAYAVSTTHLFFKLGLSWRWVQAGVCLVCCSALVAGSTFVWIAYTNNNHEQADKVAAACEWTLALGFLTFLWTLTPTLNGTYLQVAVFSHSSLHRLTDTGARQPLLQPGSSRDAVLAPRPFSPSTAASQQAAGRPDYGTNGLQSHPTGSGTDSATARSTFSSGASGNFKTAKDSGATGMYGPIFGNTPADRSVHASTDPVRLMHRKLPTNIDVHDREHFEALMAARGQAPSRQPSPPEQDRMPAAV